jgi:hypothetical protein
MLREFQTPGRRERHALAPSTTGINLAKRFVALLTLGAALAAPAAASDERDFLLEVPEWSLAVRGGWHFASASSDVFDFITDELTIDDDDFDGPVLAIEGARRLTPRLDVVVGMQTSGVRIDSEFRDFVDQDGFAIEQTTRLDQLPLTVGISFFPSPRGRAVGSYTWIPQPFAFYLGVGAGVTIYELEQEGSFVDFSDFTVFRDRFTSTGAAPTAYVSAGADIKLSPRFYLNLDARHTWAEADLDDDFVGFDPIDLSGLQTTAGVKVVF